MPESAIGGMDMEDSQRVALPEDLPVGKKLYRRPSVQVYGTLAQVTANRMGIPSAHRIDGAGPPSSDNRP